MGGGGAYIKNIRAAGLSRKAKNKSTYKLKIEF